MISDTENRYAADIHLTHHETAALDCVPLNSTQYICETVTPSTQAIVDHYLTDGVLALAGIVVLVFLAILKRRR